MTDIQLLESHCPMSDNSYNFDKTVTVGKFQIQIDSKAQYGYFEHEVLGEDRAGGLWFSNDELVDYDGPCVSGLPDNVVKGIESLGFKVDSSFHVDRV